MLESQLKRSCTKQLIEWGWIVNHTIQCSNNGWPDTQIYRKGVTLLIEFKRPGGKPRPLQSYRISKLKDQGFETLIVSDVKDIAHLK